MGDKRLSDYFADVISGTLRINEKSQRKPFTKPHKRRKRSIRHLPVSSTLQQIELPFDLRQYQEEAVEALLKHRHGIVVLPTATGKSYIAIECIKRLRLRTAILVPTEALLKQWVDKLQEAGVHPGVFYGKEHRLGNPTIFIFNSAVLHIEKLQPYMFLVFDEIHHCAADTFRCLLTVASQKPYALGLTSHVKRSDHMDYLITRVMPVVYTMPISVAQKEKYIAPLRIFQVKAQMTYTERNKYEDYCETIRKAYGYFGTTNPSELVKINHPLARACLAAIAKRKVLLSNINDKKDKVRRIILQHPKERILVFSESIVGIDAIHKHLIRNGVPCGVYHSQVNIPKRRRALRLWKDQVYQVLLSVRCLDEGIDVPMCRIGIIVASGSTTRQWIQRLGRVLRQRPGMTEGIAYIVYCPGTVESGYGRKVAWILAKK